MIRRLLAGNRSRIYVDDNDEPQLIESEYDHLSISMPTRIWNAIDSLRGDVPRSTFMRRILERSKVIADYLRREEEGEYEDKDVNVKYHKHLGGLDPDQGEGKIIRTPYQDLLSDKDGTDKHQ